MHEIKATYRIVTPMFLGGANQDPSDGIRPPSVKGALRFWWRALNWGRFCNRPGADDASALKALHKEEARLFGLAAEEVNGLQVGGQGCFLLRVTHDSLKHTDKPTIHPKFKDYAAARYLGYGLMVAFGRTDGTTHSGQLGRCCLDEDQEFTVKLIFRRGVETSVQKALIAWGLLGGLGSRSRHGMGSVALISLSGSGAEDWQAPANENDYDARVEPLFSSLPLPAIEPPFSAFWQRSRIDRLLSYTDCYGVLNGFGKAMLMYRSWGRSSPGGGSTSTWRAIRTAIYGRP